MQKFVKIAVTEPEVSKVPFMLDASKFEIVMAGLKWCQGKPIVKSISLKVGEKLFKEQATLLKKHGAAVVVMAFDKNGQAATESEKVRICKRSYDMLLDGVKFPLRTLSSTRMCRPLELEWKSMPTMELISSMP